MKNTVDNLSKSKVILMCGPAGAGKSTLTKKFESTGMTILSYDEESFKRGFNEHPLPQEVLDNKAEKGGIPIIWRPPFFVFVRK